MLMAYMFPAILLAIPPYTIMVRLGLDDTLTSLVIAHLTIALPLAVWLMYGFLIYPGVRERGRNQPCAPIPASTRPPRRKASSKGGGFWTGISPGADLAPAAVPERSHCGM
jgi:hypothetical protein